MQHAPAALGFECGGWGKKWGKVPHGFQPIPAVPHVVQRDSRFGLKTRIPPPQ
jgi:hypothetical protein